MSVAIVPSPVPAQVGQPLVYVVTVTNNGPSTASNVVLVNTQDPNVTFVSATSTAAAKPTFAAGNVTANIGTLASGAFANRDDHRDAERARRHRSRRRARSLPPWSPTRPPPRTTHAVDPNAAEQHRDGDDARSCPSRT